MRQLFFILLTFAAPILAAAQITFTSCSFQSIYVDDKGWVASNPLHEENVWQIQFGKIVCKTMDNAAFKIKQYNARGKNDVYICEGSKGERVVITVLNHGEKLVVNFAAYGEPVAMVFDIDNYVR